MANSLNNEPLGPSNADIFQATQVGLANISEQVGELGLSEIQLLMLLASKRLGSWVPLRQVKTEMPGRSCVKVTRVLHKLESMENPGRLVIMRPSVDSGREKELRLTGQGLKIAKLFTKPFTELADKDKSQESPALPQTSRRHYLTGKTALNIPSERGTGDWHFFEVFQGTHGRPPGPFFVAEKDLLDTSELLQDEGIIECSRALKAQGAQANHPVYAADHPRAMADMLYSAIKKDLHFENSYNIDDWFPAAKDKNELFRLVGKLKAGMSSQQWNRLDSWISQWKKPHSKATA
ncbi:MAG: hypothetical protein V7629_02270 [Motiliproteus sp.]